MIPRLLLLVLGSYLTLITAFYVSLFLYSLWWSWRIHVLQQDPEIALNAWRAGASRRFFFGTGLVLLAPIFLPVRLVRAWYRQRAWQRVINQLNRKVPDRIARQQWAGGLAIYADLNRFPDSVQDRLWRRLEGGEDPERVFTDIEQLLAQHERQGS